jgi:molybdate transport system ATP-binding protein
VLELEARARVGALDLDVAAAVAAGECLALAGPSGAGKTSVLRIVAGLLAPREGRVRCADETWLDTRAGIALAPEQRRCGYLFQEYALFEHLSAWRNVAYPLRGIGRAEREARARALLDRFGLAERADAHPRELSGGERQRVAVARALASDARLVLADEPTASLDHVAKRSVIAALERATEYGALLLVATHDQEVAAMCDRRFRLVDGRLVDEDAR